MELSSRQETVQDFLLYFLYTHKKTDTDSENNLRVWWRRAYVRRMEEDAKIETAEVLYAFHICLHTFMLAF
jgi:hypothetical protein